MSTAAIQPDFAASLWAADPMVPTGLRAWNGSDPGQRFMVYRNNVRSSLATALGEAFPVLRALLGEDFFRAMALEYVIATPPRSPVLSEYGGDLGDFVAGFAPLAHLPWLADVARLEQLRVQAFHAADAQPLEASRFQHWLSQPEALPDLHLRLHPSLRLLRSPFAVLSLWQAHQPEDESARDAALGLLEVGTAEDVVVWRPQLEVHACPLPPGGFECLQALRLGHTLGQALHAAAAQPGFELQSVFDRLVHDGLVIDITS